MARMVSASQSAAERRRRRCCEATGGGGDEGLGREEEKEGEMGLEDNDEDEDGDGGVMMRGIKVMCQRIGMPNRIATLLAASFGLAILGEMST